ncbi:MAG: heme-binding protein [Chloroflexi bacterium]|nr:heme-binding protein [Chloroflexota bacterium]
MTYVITELCTRDGACAEVCPVACIHTTPEAPQFYIDPEICIECEQCVVVCPVDAVFLDVELPTQHQVAETVNAQFFRKTREPVEQIALHAAMDMIHETEAYAGRMGHRISVAIVDGRGVPIAVSRMDGASPHTTELALNKAYTATIYNIATDANRLAHRSLSVMTRGRIMAGAGGIAIMGSFGAETLGAIGVAGGNNQEADVLCAQAGVTAFDGAHH